MALICGLDSHLGLRCCWEVAGKGVLVPLLVQNCWSVLRVQSWRQVCVRGGPGLFSVHSQHSSAATGVSLGPGAQGIDRDGLGVMPRSASARPGAAAQGPHGPQGNMGGARFGEKSVREQRVPPPCGPAAPATLCTAPQMALQGCPVLFALAVRELEWNPHVPPPARLLTQPAAHTCRAHAHTCVCTHTHIP